jgi:DNA replicative helicase MCM subunit Mcm2 (Cdc46/Mcm family)
MIRACRLQSSCVPLAGQYTNPTNSTLTQPQQRPLPTLIKPNQTKPTNPNSNEDIAAFERLAGQDDVYERHIFPRIAPQIFGSPDIKQAIACLLFGGSRKVGAGGGDDGGWGGGS